MFGKLSLALKVLFDSNLAAQVSELVEAGGEASSDSPKVTHQPAPEPVAEPEKRSDAVSLLATLQREARLVDFFMEPIDDYADAQVGAAVRDIHRDSRKVLERLFQPQAVIDQEEGSSVDVPADTDAGRIRRIGDQGSAGTLVHHGWQATCCELPTWNGSEDARMVIAPAEVELNPNS